MENKLQKTSLRSLKKRLRRIPAIDPPETLLNKLLTAIPEKPTNCAAVIVIEPRNRFWSFGTTVTAAALILIFICMVNYALTIPSQPDWNGVEDRSLCLADLNQSMVLHDQNDACSAAALPY